jgi:hypothetical protein
MLQLRFVHFTKTLDAVVSILKHGLVMNPCSRTVLRYFPEREEFKDREPQQFGMVCVHGFRILPSVQYWKKYGSYGIELHPTFVETTGFRRVNYVNQRSREFRQLKSRFDEAILQADQKVYAKHPEDTSRQMAYTNKNVAAILGATKWARFLSEFEYMEPHPNKFENEWRYVRPEPLYSNRTLGDVIAAVNDEESFAKYTYPLRFKPQNVLRLHTGAGTPEELRRRLPEEYRKVEINSTIGKVFRFL